MNNLNRTKDLTTQLARCILKLLLLNLINEQKLCNNVQNINGSPIKYKMKLQSFEYCINLLWCTLQKILSGFAKIQTVDRDTKEFFVVAHIKQQT